MKRPDKNPVPTILEWVAFLMTLSILWAQAFAYAGDYNRSAFRHWIDADVGYIDTRVESLLCSIIHPYP